MVDFRFPLLYVLLALAVRTCGARVHQRFGFSEAPPANPTNTWPDFALDDLDGRGRDLAEVGSAAGSNLDVDLFANVTACDALHSIIQEAPETLDQMGNFSEVPSRQMLQECSSQHSRYILNGEQLSQVIFQVYFSGPESVKSYDSGYVRVVGTYDSAFTAPSCIRLAQFWKMCMHTALFFAMWRLGLSREACRGHPTRKTEKMFAY